MKVFNFGLSKTGTTSFCKAMELLGLTSYHCPTTIDDKKAIHMLNTNDSASDGWVFINWKKVIQEFPDAKFVITTRNLESHLESCKKHFTWENLGKRDSIKWFWGDYFFNEKCWVETYFRHHAAVCGYLNAMDKDYILLNIEDGDKWDKLCEFIGKPVPAFDFPYLNRRPNRNG